MKYSLCLETVFTDLDFYDRIPLAKELGLDAFEFWEPEKFDAKTIGRLSAANNLPVSVCCMIDTRNTTLSSSWSAIKPNLLKTLEFGKEAGINKFIALTGNVTCKADSHKLLITENLKRAAEILEKENVTLLMEALNSVTDHLGYYLDSSYLGFEIIKTVDSPNVKLLYDIYHMQLMEGNLTGNLVGNIDHVGHVHSAGVPGRHELHNGEVNYPFLIKKMEEAGYENYFGFEYFPTYESKASITDILNYVKGK